MNGHPMLEFVPISKSALHTLPTLKHWIRKWSNQPQLEALCEMEWLTKGQGLSSNLESNVDDVKLVVDLEPTTVLWAPSPCIADMTL